MRILVTGGAGYIGSHTARLLRRRGHQVTIYDNLSTGHRFLAEGFSLVAADLADTETLSAALRGVDAVFHFAASTRVEESAQNPRAYFENNLVLALKLLNAALDSQVRYFIFSSSCAVYGLPDQLPITAITESTARNPINPYGASKLALEHALEAYSRAYGLGVASLRYFNAAGADESGEIGELHDPETHLIPSVLEVASGLRSELVVYGADYPTADGTCVRDYVHVNDLAEAHRLALDYLCESGGCVALNLGSGSGHSILEVISAAEKITGRTIPRRVSGRRPGDPPVLVADFRRATELLRWSPSLSLQEMVASAWNWMQSPRYRTERHRR